MKAIRRSASILGSLMWKKLVPSGAMATQIDLPSYLVLGASITPCPALPCYCLLRYKIQEEPRPPALPFYSPT